MSDDRNKIAGVIHPARDDGSPVFEIIRRDHWMQPPEGVRPCDHGNFILDEQWATVTCKKCNEKVGPFAALLYYARNYQEIKREHARLRDAKKELMFAQLKRLANLRDASDAERREIREAVRSPGKLTVEESEAMVNRITRAISERKWQRKQQRQGRTA
jgi:hypothetical protein